MRAHFGDPPPEGTKRLVLADPIDACEPLRNAEEARGALVVARRGTCTFGSKGKLVESSDAEGLILVNTEVGNQHVPGPDAHDLPLSVSMIPMIEGELLIHTLENGQDLTAAMVP